MRNSTKEIVNKLLNKNKKANLELYDSTNKSAFSFKNSTASKNSSTKSTISSRLTNTNKNTNSNVKMDQKIFKQIFEILKMRLYIESIMNIKDEALRDIINENYKLINLKDYDIQSINKFVDDLVDIAKEENKKIKEFQQNKTINNISNNLNNESKVNNLFESNEFSLNSTRRRTIQINSSGYRPTSVVTQRRRTIEIFLEKPKGNLKKDSMKFNMYEKSLKKNYSFYEGDPYNPENNINFNSEGLNEFRDKLIEEVKSKNSD